MGKSLVGASGDTSQIEPSTCCTCTMIEVEIPHLAQNNPYKKSEIIVLTIRNSASSFTAILIPSRKVIITALLPCRAITA